LSFVVNTRLFVIDSFAAFFLSMIHHFAVNTVFTVSGEVVSGLAGVLVEVLAIVAVAPVVLSARSIIAAASIVVLLPLLLSLLRFESSDVLFLLSQVIGFLRHRVHGGELLVHFHPVVREENFVCFFHCEP
jgi:hypothetical protein